MNAYLMGYMEKTSRGELKPLDMAMIAAPMLVSAGTGMAASWLMARAMAKLPDMDTNDIPAMRRAMGVHSRLPVVLSDDEGIKDNAMFSDEVSGFRDDDGNTPKDVADAGGAVVLGSNMRKAPVLLHEMGHAKVNQGGLSRLNQKYLKPIGDMYSMGSLLAAGLLRGVPLNARIALAASSLVGQVPTLISEHQATSRAKDNLNKFVAAGDVEPSKRALNTALGTYWAGALTGSLGIAAVLAYLKHRQGGLQ